MCIVHRRDIHDKILGSIFGGITAHSTIAACRCSTFDEVYRLPASCRRFVPLTNVPVPYTMLPIGWRFACASVDSHFPNNTFARLPVSFWFFQGTVILSPKPPPQATLSLNSQCSQPVLPCRPLKSEFSFAFFFSFSAVFDGERVNRPSAQPRSVRRRPRAV